MIALDAQRAFRPSIFRGRPGLSGLRRHKLGDVDDLLDVGNLTREIEDLLGRMPEDLVGKYRPEYDECRRKLDDGGVTGLYRGGRCLYDLFQEMKSAMRDRESRPISTRPPPPPSSGFPWIPVALAGVAGLGVLYFVTKG